MGISIEDKYLITSLRENKKYGVKRLLKLFPNKNWSLDGLKALIEQIDNTGTVWTTKVNHYPLHQTAVPVLSIIFHQRFQSIKTPVFVRKHFRNCYAPYFLFSGKYLIKYLSLVLFPSLTYRY